MSSCLIERAAAGRSDATIHWLPAIRVRESDSSCQRRQFSRDRRFVIEDHKTARRGEEFFVAKRLISPVWFEVLASCRSRQAAVAVCEQQGGSR